MFTALFLLSIVLFFFASLLLTRNRIAAALMTLCSVILCGLIGFTVMAFIG